MKYTNNSICYDEGYEKSFEDKINIGSVSMSIEKGQPSATYTYSYSLPESATVTKVELAGTLTDFNNIPKTITFSDRIDSIIGYTIYKTRTGEFPQQKVSARYNMQSDTLLQVSITSSIEGGNTGTPLLTKITNVVVTIYYTALVDDINFTSTNISIMKPVSFGGDVSIGGSLTIPSDKGLKVDELTGSSIDIGDVEGGSINISAIKGGAININAITGGSLTCKVSTVGNEATSLTKGHLYYVPTQTLTYGNTTIPGFILYYANTWEATNPFYIKKGTQDTTYYSLAINEDRLTVKQVYDAGGYGGNTIYTPDIKYYELPITITF